MTMLKDHIACIPSPKARNKVQSDQSDFFINSNLSFGVMLLIFGELGSENAEDIIASFPGWGWIDE